MKTVLVVEDDPAIAELVCGILEDEGYAVVTAGDGLRGLEQLRERSFDLVFADLMMPHLNGREFRQAMCATPALRALPTILMTAASYVTDDDRGDFAAVLHKPFQLDEVLSLIDQLLGR